MKLEFSKIKFLFNIGKFIRLGKAFWKIAHDAVTSGEKVEKEEAMELASALKECLLSGVVSIDGVKDEQIQDVISQIGSALK